MTKKYHVSGRAFCLNRKEKKEEMSLGKQICSGCSWAGGVINEVFISDVFPVLSQPWSFPTFLFLRRENGGLENLYTVPSLAYPRWLIGFTKLKNSSVNKEVKSQKSKQIENGYLLVCLWCPKRVSPQNWEVLEAGTLRMSQEPGRMERL